MRQRAGVFPWIREMMMKGRWGNQVSKGLERESRAWLPHNRQEENTYTARRVKTSWAELHSTQIFDINHCPLCYMSEVLCSMQHLEKFIIPYVTSRSKHKNKVSKWKEITEHLNCRLKREWNDFFLGNNIVFHFLLCRVRTSTINFCYQKALRFWRRNVHFDCLFICMHLWEKLSHLYMITS